MVILAEAIVFAFQPRQLVGPFCDKRTHPARFGTKSWGVQDCDRGSSAKLLPVRSTQGRPEKRGFICSRLRQRFAGWIGNDAVATRSRGFAEHGTKATDGMGGSPKAVSTARYIRRTSTRERRIHALGICSHAESRSIVFCLMS